MTPDAPAVAVLALQARESGQLGVVAVAVGGWKVARLGREDAMGSYL